MNTEAIKAELAARKALLQQRADKVERDASHRDAPLSADFAEQAVERENDDVLTAIGAESRHEIDLINKALQRLEDGEYGECQQCGGDIDELRLAAVPYAELCILCAEQQEEQN
ncbi:TraR/DksA family transcriptional regulator [Bacterioplanoides pacificum]|uniref:TraR/DksA family transcriptional regulator n=1 Tax=Bacterioplanoides pacificum TaxID=1171596 RepID=A0ABV7VW36_9GAMM